MDVVRALMFLVLCSCVYADESLLCTKSFCKDYTSKTPCSKQLDACQIQNSTHNGVELPAPVPCGCCNYCLQNLFEGDGCAVGDPSSPTPTKICGGSLTCKEPLIGNKDPTCKKKYDTECLRAQKKYDDDRKSGALGQLQVRPKCNRNGLYEPYVCVPGEICYCVSEDGLRLFGETPVTPTTKKLSCQCSRNYHKGKEIRDRNLHQSEYFRCTTNGDYDTLQCIDDQCLCADAEDGQPTYRNKEFINMTMISAETLPCFDNETHIEGEYYRECESLYRERIKIIRDYEREGFEVFGYTLPNCQLDGRYGPVQEDANTKYCADPLGNLLENFKVLQTDLLARSMDCNCARTRSIMLDGEKPECCPNGNYQKMQCRRGVCYCVDRNGLQVEKEVDYDEKAKLTCAEKLCD